MIKITKKEIVILVVLYLVGLFLWTLPFQDQQIPYGEGDGSIHYFIANYMSSSDKPIVKLPNATSVWSLHDRDFNKKNYLFNPPQYHTSFAIMQIVSTNPVISFYLYLAIMASFVFFTLYFLVRHLYGPIVGLLASFLMTFSLRDQLTYLWGQWSTAFGFVFIPLILYTYYAYTNSVIEKKEKPLYLYLLALLFVFQFLFHALGFLIVVPILAVYTVLLFIKEKKLPFNIKHAAFCVAIFLVLVSLFAPLQINQIIARFDSGFNPIVEEQVTEGFFNRVFGWYNFPGGGHGVPDFYFSFDTIYYGYWMLPFLLIGIAYLALNRRRQDLLILSTLIAFYVITHLDLVGIILGAKYPRIFYYESLMFYPIIAIGVTRLTSFFKFKGKIIAKYLIIIGFVVAILMINGKASYNLFNTAYDGIGRLNAVEIEGIEWINKNLPKNSYLMLVGVPSFKQQAWTQAMVPEKVFVFDQDKPFPVKDGNLNKTTHIVMDYSIFYMINQQDALNALLAWEKNNTKEENLLYNQNNIYKVFKLE